MTPSELMVPPTEVEVADLLGLVVATTNLSSASVNTLRRLAFDRDRLRDRVTSLEGEVTRLHQQVSGL